MRTIENSLNEKEKIFLRYTEELVKTDPHGDGTFSVDDILDMYYKEFGSWIKGVNDRGTFCYALNRLALKLELIYHKEKMIRVSKTNGRGNSLSFKWDE